MPDPFAPSSDPDIPTPTRSDLLNLVHGSVRDQLAAGALDAKHAENEWAGARRQWDEGHKRDAERRRKEAKPDQEIGLPLVGGELEETPPDSEFTGTFRDIKPLNETVKGTRVVGQTRAPTEQERRDAELLNFMPDQVRAAYDQADAEQKDILWKANQEAFDAAQERKEQRRLREQKLTAKALDMLQRIKEDPSKEHLLPPANASIPELHEWYKKMREPVRTIPFPNLSEEQIRRERIWNDIQRTGRADPKDIAEEEAEAERYRRRLAAEREKKRQEVEAEFLPRRPFPEGSLGEHLLEATSRNVAEAERLLGISERNGNQAIHKEAEPKPSWLDKFWKFTDSNLLWGGGIGVVFLAYGFEWAGVPPKVTIIMAVFAWLVISISIWRHRFFDRWIIPVEVILNGFISLLVAALIVLGWIIFQPTPILPQIIVGPIAFSQSMRLLMHRQ